MLLSVIFNVGKIISSVAKILITGTSHCFSINRKIQTIEAKLKQMEHEATSSQEPKTLTTQPHRLTTLPHKHHATQPQRPHDRRPYDRTHKCGRWPTRSGQCWNRSCVISKWSLCRWTLRVDYL